MKQVIITGGTGFIGSRLSFELMESGIKVILLVRDRGLCYKKLEYISGVIESGIHDLTEDNPLLEVIEYDSAEYDELLLGGKEIDAFYHLAWGGVSTEDKNDTDMQLENIRFSIRMLEYASVLNCNKFIGIGTVAEYCFCEDVMDVNAKQTPNDMYGASKTAAHYLMETRARLLKLPFIWTVVPSTFGEGRRDSNVLTYTINTLLKGERPSYGYLTQMWDFLYVGEVARALHLIGERGIEGKTYGIGSGVYRPLREYIEIIRDSIDKKLPLGVGDIPAQSDKAFSSCVNINELKEDTGFVPAVSFEEGIEKTIEYYRSKAE